MGAISPRFGGWSAACLAIALASTGFIAPSSTAAAAAAGVARFGSAPLAPAMDLTPVSVIVTYRGGTTVRGRELAHSRAGVQAARSDTARPGGAVQREVVRPARGQGVAEAIRALKADPRVLSAEPNLRRQLTAGPGDEPNFQPYQWGLENVGPGCVPGYAVACTTDVDIDALGAWPTATGAGITIAVLDDGVDFSHPELTGQAWVNEGETGPDELGRDRETNGLDDDGNGYVDDVQGVNLCEAAGPADELHDPGEDWHGTAVAGVIASAANGVGIAGVAPDARIMAVRWLVADYVSCTDDMLAAEAVRYAVDNGADIINASWGGTGMSSILAEAIDYANTNGVLIVAAAGNSNTAAPFYPAASDSPNVVSVGSIDPNGYRSSFSNYGSWVDIAAPGRWILGAWVNMDEGCPDPYCYLNGTSFAAPHVAGIAALASQVQPSLLDSASTLRSRVISSGWKNSRIASGLSASARVADAGYAIDVAPPTPPSSVTARARTGSTIGSTTVPSTIGWGPASDETGIEYYRVRYRVVGTTAWTTLVAQTTSRTTTAALRLGSAYEIEVAARDRGANLAATTITVSPTKYEESSTRWTYGGTWVSQSSSTFSGGKVRSTGAAGRWAALALTGRSVALVMPRGPTRGSANIYLDGAWKATVSLYARTTSTRGVVWSLAWPTAGPHTVKVVVKGTSGHPRVDIDAAIVAR